ncbi:MAG: hypothetical protein R2706_06190 [Acidimicrobiales bacterium]
MGSSTTTAMARPSGFAIIGAGADAAGLVHHGVVGAAASQLMSMRSIVDFGASWMSDHRR